MTTCTWEGCNVPTSGNSKYCKEHKALARQAWVAMIAEGAEDRKALYADFEALVRKAMQAGSEALQMATPTPVLVVEHRNPLDDNSPVVQSWPVTEGACGFAWIKIGPATTKFSRWLMKNADHLGLRVGNAYYGGLQISVRGGGQSIERKEAYAQAFADVLKAGLKSLDPKTTRIYADSRLD